MKLLLSFLLGLLVSGCTKSVYHVATVQSEQVKPIATDYVFENDELRLVYNLWEPGGRIRFLLLNKTDKSLYIDWTKSSLVRNEVRTFYNQLPQLSKRKYVDTVRYTYQTKLAQPYRITAQANPFSEIPSQTYVALADFPIQQVLLHAKTSETMFTYTKENSPLKVSQQLVYSDDKTLINPRSIEHVFWVDTIRVLSSHALTKRYGSLKKGQPNALYVVEERAAPAQTAILAVSIIAGTTGGLIILLKDMFSGFTLGF